MSTKKTFIIAVALDLLIFNQALAGHYELLGDYPTGVHDTKFQVFPENLEVCKAYEKNLNSFPEIRSVMVCERPINSKLKDFKKPDWQTLDVLENKDFIKKIEKQSEYYRANPNNFNEKQWDETFKARVEERGIKLRYAKLEIDSDKYKHVKSEYLPLYILEYEFRGKCDPFDERWLENSGGIEYFITTKEMKEILPIIGLGGLRGVFIYKGDIYFDALSYTWNDKLKKKQYEIWLYKMYYRTGEFARVPICRFRYIGKVTILK